jgi:2-dehydropantoate 2-reductase
MRLTVWGAGAIGGITGASLARAGHSVLLVDANAEHVAAMRRDGLVILDERGDWRAPVEAATPPEVQGPLERVLLAVKAAATATAVEQIAPQLAPGGVVVSLQNGLNPEIIAARIGADRTLGCLVNWAGDWIAPGRIQFGGEGSFVLGELNGQLTPRLQAIGDLLSLVMPVRLTENLWGFLWAKTCYASLLFATALTDETIYDVVERSLSIQRMLVRLVAEAMAVAEASGVRLETFDEYDPALYRRGAAGDEAAVREAMAAVSSFYRRHTKVKTGIWRDLVVRRRKTEVDQQPGMVVAKGRALGIPTPLTARLVHMIHEREEGARPMGWANLEELATSAG